MAQGNGGVLIIGGGIAGRNVCRELMRLGHPGPITIVKRESHGSYSPCGLPYVMGGEVKTMEDLLFPSFDRRLREHGIRVRTGTLVRNIDPLNKLAETSAGESIPYDIVVIATGRQPRIPSLPGIEKRGIHTLSDYEDGLRMYDELNGAKSAVVIGGGFIGCELVTAFLKRGIATTLVETKLHLLPQILDAPMAVLVQDRIAELGCRVVVGARVARINGGARAESISVEGEEAPIEADMIVMAVGVRPETGLAARAGFEIGTLGGVVTDRRQRPKMHGKPVEDVYACGDCVEVKEMLTGNSALNPLTDAAIVQARIIALDIAKQGKAGRGHIGGGCVCSSLTVIGGWEVGASGLTNAEAEKAGMHPTAVQAAGWSREVYYPGRTRVHIRLLTSENRLIGVQGIGQEGVRGMINELNAYILARTSIGDIACRQRSYTPALSSSPDALMRALEKLPA